MYSLEIETLIKLATDPKWVKELIAVEESELSSVPDSFRRSMPPDLRLRKSGSGWHLDCKGRDGWMQVATAERFADLPIRKLIPNDIDAIRKAANRRRELSDRAAENDLNDFMNHGLSARERLDVVEAMGAFRV